MKHFLTEPRYINTATYCYGRRLAIFAKLFPSDLTVSPAQDSGSSARSDPLQLAYA